MEEILRKTKCSMVCPCITESRHNDKTFGQPNWFDHVKKEVAACRNGAALFDLSSLAKFEVEVSAVCGT